MGREGSPRPPQAEGGCGAARPSLLWALPEELLLLICSYLDAQALGRLGQVCRRLRAFSGRDLLWRRIARGCLNSGFTQLGADLAAGIPVKERVKVSQNWRHGRCRRETLLKWKRNLMPWMHLDGDYLYLSQAEDIWAYRFRPDSAGLQRRPQAIFSGHQEDVCRFVLTGSHIVSGGGDGNIVLSKVHGSFSIKFSAHQQEVNCVDCQGGIIVSGSRDRTAKVWSLSSGRVGHCLHTVQTEDRVWSIAISPLLSSFVTGTACCGHTSPLRIWDLESGQLATCLGTDFHRGAGVLDIVYETPFTLLSCGYDTYIRSWDLRVSTRASRCPLPPAAPCTASASTPPTFMLPWRLPCTPLTSPPPDACAKVLPAPQLPLAAPGLADLMLSSGIAGREKGKWPWRLLKEFLSGQKASPLSAGRARLSPTHLPFTLNKGKLSFTPVYFVQFRLVWFSVCDGNGSAGRAVQTFPSVAQRCSWASEQCRAN
ncbi:F-box/WD repeat-containing protein 4 isoform X3 [Gopherus flavomarginatus]|uniref:F-box/WD repeat-containing protein 4 isoform X3 n=1 Tax=Gopherus flavomarginatus TaxID=286002 RepID=UPI0021CBF66D|nr:F-box/WD repeat-containing protein 4 isoform X3 [Gopherus flavomarginatus]